MAGRTAQKAIPMLHAITLMHNTVVAMIGRPHAFRAEEALT
jgi:hypothetical protein